MINPDDMLDEIQSEMAEKPMLKLATQAKYGDTTAQSKICDMLAEYAESGDIARYYYVKYILEKCERLCNNPNVRLRNLLDD